MSDRGARAKVKKKNGGICCVVGPFVSIAISESSLDPCPLASVKYHIKVRSRCGSMFPPQPLRYWLSLIAWIYVFLRDSQLPTFSSM